MAGTLLLSTSQFPLRPLRPAADTVLSVVVPKPPPKAVRDVVTGASGQVRAACLPARRRLQLSRPRALGQVPLLAAACCWDRMRSWAALLLSN